MFTLTASGFIGSMNLKTTPSGAKLMILRIGCNTSVKDERSHQWRKETFWVEALAWNERADEWEKRFKVGDAVEVTGRPNFRTWTNASGETAKTITVYGMEGETPNVSWATGRSGAGEASPAAEAGAAPREPRAGRYRSQAPERADIPF